jgi:hypothetical protein
VTSIEDILAEATPAETVVPLFLRGDLAGEYDRLAKRLETASREAVSLGEPSEWSVIAEQMTALREQMLTSQVEFRLRAMDSRSWSDFFAKRPDPPTAKEGEEVAEDAQAQFKADWHVWVCSMVAATVYDPKMTGKQADRLARKLSDSNWKELTEVVYAVNTGRQSIPFFDAASANLQGTARR